MYTTTSGTKRNGRISIIQTTMLLNSGAVVNYDKQHIEAVVVGERVVEFRTRGTDQEETKGPALS